MSRLGRKFFLSLSAVLLAVLFLTVYLNGHFIGRYFLYQEKREMRHICEQLLTEKESLQKKAEAVEMTGKAVIIQVPNSEDNELLNERLREAFLQKGIGFHKYWLWEQDQQEALQKGIKMRLYSQDTLPYSLLAAYLPMGDTFLTVIKIVPSVYPTITLVNRVTTVVFTLAVFTIFLLVFLLVRRIIIPLRAIGETAKAIAALDFKMVEIHTHDELELLAEDINAMSGSLKEAHQALNQKNRQMEELLSNVSHDLKTPVALIKAYTSGIKDGMDDGTFLDTIEKQNERMEEIIERLLHLAKVRQTEGQKTSVSLSECLENLLWDYRIQAENYGLSFVCRVEPELVIESDFEAIRLIFSNLISNAVKYARGETIHVLLEKRNGSCFFEIQNQTGELETIEADRIWEPFYVAEKSRNKGESGTGLGLCIVKAAAEKYDYICTCHVEKNTITFLVQF